MMTFYDYLPSQNAYKVRLLLNHLDRPVKTQFVSIFEGAGRTAEYLSINPMGAVPALRLEDGRTISESNAILTYLADRTKYTSNDAYERAKIAQWMNFEADYIQSGIAQLRHWRLTGKDKNQPPVVLKNKVALGLRTLKALDQTLSHVTFLVGDQYSIADMAIYAYIHLSEDAGLSLQPYAAISQWIQCIQQQPGYLSTMYPYSIDPYSSTEL